MFPNGNAINSQGQVFFKKLKKIVSDGSVVHIMFFLSEGRQNLIFWQLVGTETSSTILEREFVKDFYIQELTIWIRKCNSTYEIDERGGRLSDYSNMIAPLLDIIVYRFIVTDIQFQIYRQLRLNTEKLGSENCFCSRQPTNTSIVGIFASIQNKYCCMKDYWTAKKLKLHNDVLNYGFMLKQQQ